jgi:hypothetical protein
VNRLAYFKPSTRRSPKRQHLDRRVVIVIVEVDHRRFDASTVYHRRHVLRWRVRPSELR